MKTVHDARIRAAKIATFNAHFRTALRNAAAGARRATDALTDMSSAFRSGMLALQKQLIALRYGPTQDDEILALRLAKRHVAEGRPDLAAEDMAWLERRWVADARLPEAA